MYRVKNIRKQFSWLCWLLCWLLCSHCPSICSIASNTTEDDSVAVFAPIDAVITQDNSHHTRFSSSLEWTNFRIYNKERVIIEMAGNAAQPGRLLGILGPSGSGKSTFLRAIASRSRKNLRKEGNIYYVKETGEKTKLGKHEVAFVHQDDSFFGMLTVQETLKLALELRCNSKAFNLNQRRLSKQEREHIIKDTLHLLGLNKISDSQVGGRSTSLDDQAHGISGGERKRLSVACEMMGNPRMLIADEPTSGLDSFQALQVMTTLHDIARTKQIITICTVHQPRSTIWNLFDDVMILSPLGKVVYFGPRENVLTYLESIGFPCPGNTNPAEYLIDLVSIDNTTPITIQQSISRIETLIHKFEEYQMKSNRKESTGSTSTSVASGRIGINVPETKPHSHLASVTAKPMRMIRTVLSSMKRSLSRFSLLFGRALKQTIRDSKTNIARVGISALLALVISSVYGEQGQQIDPKSISNRVNIIAQAAINVAMLSMIKTLQLFKKERAVIDRERSQDQYNSVEYLLAKTSAELPVDALVSAVSE